MKIGYTVEVTNVSPRASEKDVYDFFSFSGAIEHIEILRSGEYSAVAYVTFKEAYALETAVLLSGATIVDQPVCIARWGNYEDDAYNLWTTPSMNTEEEYLQAHSSQSASAFVSSPGEALTVAQEVVKTMLAKGYVLSKDAFWKAKALDESYQVSAGATARVSELSRRVGLTDKINAVVETAKFADERFHFVDNTKAAASATGKAASAAASATGKVASAAATAVVNSSYFSAGALWFSDALSRASQAAADLATHGINK